MKCNCCLLSLVSSHTPPLGHHAEENERQNEAKKHGTDDARVSGHATSRAFARSECRLPNKPQ